MNNPPTKEIKKACQSVGWEWDEEGSFAWDPNPNGERRMPRFARRHEWEGDSIAQLEAWRNEVNRVGLSSQRFVTIKLEGLVFVRLREVSYPGDTEAEWRGWGKSLPIAAEQAILNYLNGDAS